MNEVILRQYQIKCLVTKVSGNAGGYQEKLDAAEKLGIPCKVARIHSSDVFYQDANRGSYTRYPEKYGAKCVEMESFALFSNARVLGKNAACILTISDSLVTHRETTAQQRQTAFTDMMEIALGAAAKL